MTILPVLRYQNPILRAKSELVEKVNQEIQRIIGDIIETMYASPGCVGVAAPQVGYPLRIFVIDVSRKTGPKKNHGLLVFINPVIVYAEGEKIIREGCLSIPDFLGNVKRARITILRGINREGEGVEILSQGLEAIAVQHEIDHLDGVLFIHRVNSVGTDITRRKKPTEDPVS
jgi:peptide deformylase